MTTLADDAALAAELAASAGKLLLELRSTGLWEGKALGDEGDRLANRFLVDSLRKFRPDDGLLSEEEKDCRDRLAKSRVWIVDPVDGTREYGEGRADWAVHVGLAVNGEPLVGAVALPGLEGSPVMRSDMGLPLPPCPARLRILVSRSRPAAEALSVARQLDAELVAMGSAGAKAMAVVRGDAEIYLHSGGQYEWDNMAPVAVAMAYGLHCSRIDGSQLRYNSADVYLPDLLICRPELAERVLDMV